MRKQRIEAAIASSFCSPPVATSFPSNLSACLS
jgi:hypothetical protein